MSSPEESGLYVRWVQEDELRGVPHGASWGSTKDVQLLKFVSDDPDYFTKG